MKGADRLNSFSESQTLALTKKVREMKAEGKDVLGLTLGEPNFDTPKHISEAAIQAIVNGHTHYPPVAGIPELKQAISEKFFNQNQIPCKPENVVVSTGAKQSLVNLIMSLVNPGDEVIMLAPYWVSYYQMVLMAEGIPVVLEAGIEEKYLVKAASIDKAITSKTKLLIINSPSNPSGSMFSRAEMDALVKALEKHPHVLLISDEIYEHLTYGIEHISPSSYASIQNRTITVNGVSKSFAMTGWRIGYICAPKWIAELCEKFQGQYTSGANTIAQWASLAALQGEMYPTYAMRDQFRERRELMYKGLSEISGVKTLMPDGAFYFYPDVSSFFGKKSPSGKIMSDISELCMYLLEEGLVAVIPGDAFGTKSHVRISYAYKEEELRTAVLRLQDAFYRLK